MISGVTRFIVGPERRYAFGGPKRGDREDRLGKLAFKACLAFGVLLALMAARPALAQLTPLQKQEMKQHYEKATRAYDVQKYTEAVDEYQKAYEIGGDPAMLYNVAQSYRLADQPSDALRFYRRYLQRSPNARNREDVERKIADLEKTMEERRKAAAAAAAPAPVAPPPAAVPPPVAPAPIVREDQGMGGVRIAGIVVTSVGAAALVAAAVTGKMAAGKGDDLTHASEKMETFDPEVEKSGKSLDTFTKIAAIAGGALAVAGVIMIVVGGNSGEVSPTPSTAQAFVTPVFGGGTVGAAASLRF